MNLYTLICLSCFSLLSAGELHRESGTCNADRMKQLLSGKPSVNELNESGMTPLHIAIDARQKTCVNLLLKSGASPEIRDLMGRTAWIAAAQIKNQLERSAIEHELKSKHPGSSSDQRGTVPWSLEYSVLRGQTDVTKLLLKMGANPDAPGTKGTVPLSDAALKGDLESARLLLEAGAKPDAESKYGTQPIHDAALGDCAEIIQELIKRGVDVNARTREELQTPLHIAAAMGKMKSIETLISLGADLSAKDSRGRTPLVTADQAGLADVVRILRAAMSDR